jgi:hypothetical protein
MVGWFNWSRRRRSNHFAAPKWHLRQLKCDTSRPSAHFTTWNGSFTVHWHPFEQALGWSRSLQTQLHSTPTISAANTCDWAFEYHSLGDIHSRFNQMDRVSALSHSHDEMNARTCWYSFSRVSVDSNFPVPNPLGQLKGLYSLWTFNRKSTQSNRQNLSNTMWPHTQDDRWIEGMLEDPLRVCVCLISCVLDHYLMRFLFDSNGIWSWTCART